jgi:hypothetical protein
MLAGHEQDDDVTMLVMHVPAVPSADGPASGNGPPEQRWAQR